MREDYINLVFPLDGLWNEAIVLDGFPLARLRAALCTSRQRRKHRWGMSSHLLYDTFGI
jgi:hypothetical protein